MDHFENPRNVGEPDGAGPPARAENPVCGDEVALWLRLEDGRVADARFRAFGCHATIAAMSLLTERVRGGSAEEAAALGREELMDAFDDFPRGKVHAAEVAVEVLGRALRGGGA